jgi:putative oxidoreductase
VDRIDVALLVLRLVFGLFLAYHGLNKVRGGLAGTAKWFASIGMKWPMLQARMAAGTEIVAGLLFAAGLLTPFAAAGMVGVMLVAIWAVHWKVGFWVFLPNQGWEYCGSIAVVAWAVGATGAGRWSLDHAFGIALDGWTGAVVAGVLGVGAAAVQLAACYRPAVAR